MTDIVFLELIKSLFWLIVLGVAIYFFRREIKNFLHSLGSFNVAGATFQLKNQKETLQSYVLLADTLIDILSRSDRIEAMLQVVQPTQIEKLGTFALKYIDEVGEEQWNEELLRNIAYLLLRAGRYSQSVKLYDALLIRRPDHVDLLNLKALALLTSRLQEKVQDARSILENLSNRYPEITSIRFNLALSQSLLGEHTDVEKNLRILASSDYPKHSPNFLEDPLLHRTTAEKPDLILELKGRTL